MIVTRDDGTTLAMEVAGPEGAEALLLINSLGCDRSMWAAQAQALAQRYRVIRFDTRGHGGSAAPTGDYTLAQLGADALAVLDHAGVGRAHVCGISLGGITAQYLALHAPARVGRLVLANTAARIGTVEAWTARRDTVLTQGMAAIAGTVLGRFFSAATPAATVEAFRRILLATSPQGYAGCCAALRDADLREDVAAIASPTLVIGGRHDLSTPPAEAGFLAARIPGATLLILETAHLANIEAPAGFTAAVRQHLDAA